MNEYKTVSIPTAIGNQMKPIKLYAGEDRAGLRRQQEDYIFDILGIQEYSINARSLADVIADEIRRGLRSNFPKRYYPLGDTMPGTRDISQVLKRLEAKGFIISTLYMGRRFYSIPGKEVK